MTLTIKIKALGVFRRIVGRNSLSLDLEKATVNDVLHALAAPLSPEAVALLFDPELHDPRPNMLILLNGREISLVGGLEAEIRNDDELTLVPIAHGG